MLLLGTGIAFSLVFNKKQLLFSDNFIRWVLFFSVGIQGMWYGIWQIFHGKEVAASIGWAYSPFLFEVGFCNLSCGVAGILSLKFGREYRLCLSIVYGIFLLGAAYKHLESLIVDHNFSFNNAGPIFYTDILIPSLLLIFWVISSFLKKKH